MQTGATLLRYASPVTEQYKCWDLLGQKFDRFQTVRNKCQQVPALLWFHVNGRNKPQPCWAKQCWVLLANNVASVRMGLKTHANGCTKCQQLPTLLGVVGQQC